MNSLDWNTDGKIETVQITPQYLSHKKKDDIIQICMSLLRMCFELQEKNELLLSENTFLLTELESMGTDMKVLNEQLRLQTEANFNRGSERMPGPVIEVPVNVSESEDREKQEPESDCREKSEQKTDDSNGESTANQKSASKNKNSTTDCGKGKSSKKDRLGNSNCETRVVECRFDTEWFKEHPNAKRLPSGEYEEYVRESRLVRYLYKVERAELEGEVDDEGKPVIVSAGSRKPLVKGCKMSSRLVCQAMFSKYELGMPYNRQSSELLLEGNEISKQNLDHWTQYAWNTFFCFIYVFMGLDVKKLHILNMDETTIPVNMLMKIINSRTGWIAEARSGKYEEIQIVYYRFVISRDQKFMGMILDMKNGVYVIQSDGCTIYVNWKNVTNVFCHDHCRREFVKAMKVTAGFEKYRKLVRTGAGQNEIDQWLNRPGNAELKGILEILNLYKILYRNERTYKKEKLTPEEIYERRQAESKPILDQIYEKIDSYYIESKRPQPKKKESDEDFQVRLSKWEQDMEEAKAAGKTIVKKGKLADAIRYATEKNKRIGLYRYLEDGHYQISNISAEIGMKTWSRLRNNSRFADTINGAVMAAGMNSIIKTAELNHLNPQLYLIYVMEQMNAVHKKGQAYEEKFLASLMPYSKELPEYLYVGKENHELWEPKDRDILFFNGADPVPVAVRNPDKEEYYAQLKEDYPGDFGYRQIRILKRREERQSKQKYERSEPPVFGQIPERLCS